jgi:hypothetical protein
VDGPDGRHRCLVHAPLWESVLTFLHRNPVRRLPTPIVAFILKNLFLALDFLHAECEIIHTGTDTNEISNFGTNLARMLLLTNGIRYQSR